MRTVTVIAQHDFALQRGVVDQTRTAGEVFDVPSIHAVILLHAGHVRLAPYGVSAAPARRRYRRRDLRADL